MDINYDYKLRMYVIKYRVGNQEIISYLDGNTSTAKVEEWRAYHLSQARHLAINEIMDDSELDR
jgi:hypothetical protein